LIRQVAEKRPSAALPSSFVVAAYFTVRLTPQDSGALHLGIFEQPANRNLFSTLIAIYHFSFLIAHGAFNDTKPAGNQIP